MSEGRAQFRGAWRSVGGAFTPVPRHPRPVPPQGIQEEGYIVFILKLGRDGVVQQTPRKSDLWALIVGLSANLWDRSFAGGKPGMPAQANAYC